MRKKRKPTTIIEGVEILEMAAEGKCVAKVNEKVIFVDHAAPGDVADVQIIKDKRRFAEGIPVKITHFSEKRSTPFCEHFGVCGGCKWQHINYATQLYYKEKQVRDNLERIAKVKLPSIDPIVPSPEQQFYRNKLEYTFSNKRWLTQEEIITAEELDRNALGFHIPGRFDKVININNCYLQPSPSNSIRNAVNEFAKQNHLTFFDLYEQKGLLRNLIIRTSNTNQTMVIVQFFEDEPTSIESLLQFLKNSFPEITSLLYIINTKKNESYHDQEVLKFYGNDYIVEEMDGIKFRIGPKSFFQTNSQQAKTLYHITRELAGLKGAEIVYDLYTGTGTIANFVASQCRKVIGLEYVEMAIEDAKQNSTLNTITNTEFFAGDIKDLLTIEFYQNHGFPDVIITDPPRAGMHEDVVNMLLVSGAKKIVYVSCNPATQARDLLLLDLKYQVEKVQPVDMFPHTHHVENVILLTLRN